MNPDNFFSELSKIQSWPDVALVMALVIIVGYLFRFWRNFPNSAIPAIVILTGAVAMMLLAPEHPASMSARVWHVRNCIVGLIVGFVGWMGHNLVISKLEDWLATKFDFVGRLLNKTPEKETLTGQVK